MDKYLLRKADIDDIEGTHKTHFLNPGDGRRFSGLSRRGEAHSLKNIGTGVLKCIVVGQRLEYDVADYPLLRKRLYRSRGRRWNLVDFDAIVEPDRRS